MRAEVVPVQPAPRVAPEVARPRAAAAWRILRPGNGAMSMAGVGVGAVVAAGPASLLGPAAPLAAVAAFAATGFGNVLNDLTDVEVDKLAHPKRPLAAGDLTPAAARGMAVGLAGGALVLGALVSWPAALFVLAALGTMALYEFALKARGLPGNLAVAVLTGAPFLFGALAVGGPPALTGAAALLALLAALANLGREILKDVEDMAGDLDRATLPQRYGRPVARQVAGAALLAAVLLSPFPFVQGHSAWPYLPLVAAADALFVVAAVHSRAGRAQSLAKAGMLVALVAFLAGEVAA